MKSKKIKVYLRAMKYFQRPSFNHGRKTFPCLGNIQKHVPFNLSQRWREEGKGGREGGRGGMEGIKE